MESAAAWTAVVLALGGIALSAYSIRLTRSTYRETVERDDAGRAGRVTAWMAHKYAIRPDGGEELGGNGVLINNDSGMSVHALQFTATTKGYEGNHTLELCPPGEFYVAWTGFTHRHLDCGHGAHPWDFPTELTDLRSRGFHFRPYTQSAKWAVPSFSFSDHTGARWQRDRSGAVRTSRKPETRPCDPCTRRPPPPRRARSSGSSRASTRTPSTT